MSTSLHLSSEVDRERRVSGCAEVWQAVDGGADLAERRVPVEVELQYRLARELDERHAVVVEPDTRTRHQHLVDKRLQRQRGRNLFARYITKQKINNKNSTMAGHQKRH